MTELKTRPSSLSVETFINNIPNEGRRIDSLALLEIFKEVTGEAPKMWGGAIIGFGEYHYKYQSGREGDWFKSGFSPRKQNLTLYFLPYLFDKEPELLQKLGKFKTGKGCLYINKLSDVDITGLKTIITRSVTQQLP